MRISVCSVYSVVHRKGLQGEDMIIKFLKRSVIEVLEAVSALASVFAYMLAANFISELLRLSDGGFMFLATALTGPAINTFMRVTDRFDRWKERAGVSYLW